MHLRIQTSGEFISFLLVCLSLSGDNNTGVLFLTIYIADSTTALEALEKGMDDLMDLCDVVTEKFTVARDQFNEESSNRMVL